VPVIRAVLRPRPRAPIGGRRAAFFCTAPPSAHARLASHLAEAHGADVSFVSGNLADRARLKDDLTRADADIFVVELKAAAVDVVVEEAARRGTRIVIAANDVVPLPGEPPLADELERLAAEAVAQAQERVQW
jgi:cyclic 2,3-diphosphoglycerate synthetase